MFKGRVHTRGVNFCTKVDILSAKNYCSKFITLQLTDLPNSHFCQVHTTRYSEMLRELRKAYPKLMVNQPNKSRQKRARYNSDLNLTSEYKKGSLSTDYEIVSEISTKNLDNIRITFEKFSFKKKTSRSGYSTCDETNSENEV